MIRQKKRMHRRCSGISIRVGLDVKRVRLPGEKGLFLVTLIEHCVLVDYNVVICAGRLFMD